MHLKIKLFYNFTLGSITLNHQESFFSADKMSSWWNDVAPKIWQLTIETFHQPLKMNIQYELACLTSFCYPLIFTVVKWQSLDTWIATPSSVVQLPVPEYKWTQSKGPMIYIVVSSSSFTFTLFSKQQLFLMVPWYSA